MIGLCTTFQVSSIGRKGPVLVSMFSPFQTVFSAFISFIFFGQWIGTGWYVRLCRSCVTAVGALTFNISIVMFIFGCSLVGIALMFAGLDVVLWAKNREDKMFAELAVPSDADADATESDIERPFLR